MSLLCVFPHSRPITKLIFPITPKVHPGKQAFLFHKTIFKRSLLYTQLFTLEFPLPPHKVAISFTSKPYFQTLCLCSLSRSLHISIPRHSWTFRTRCQFESAQNNQYINSPRKQWDFSNTICPTWTLSFRTTLPLKRNSQRELVRRDV